MSIPSHSFETGGQAVIASVRGGGRRTIKKIATTEYRAVASLFVITTFGAKANLVDVGLGHRVDQALKELDVDFVYPNFRGLVLLHDPSVG
ncbi:MAG: hypothetical protein HYU02_02360, partial [Thaumarchaeota archaeon]|nr:hypothetical protein [Nitrososphaerota archaeon]